MGFAADVAANLRMLRTSPPHGPKVPEIVLATADHELEAVLAAASVMDVELGPLGEGGQIGNGELSSQTFDLPRDDPRMGLLLLSNDQDSHA
jgi:hypothetical protein